MKSASKMMERAPSRSDPARAVEAHMNTATLLTVSQVANMLSISTREVWRRSDSGALPRPIRLGERTRRWVREEIEAVIERAKRQRDAR